MKTTEEDPVKKEMEEILMEKALVLKMEKLLAGRIEGKKEKKEVKERK